MQEVPTDPTTTSTKNNLSHVHTHTRKLKDRNNGQHQKIDKSKQLLWIYKTTKKREKKNIIKRTASNTAVSCSGAGEIRCCVFLLARMRMQKKLFAAAVNWSVGLVGEFFISFFLNYLGDNDHILRIPTILIIR